MPNLFLKFTENLPKCLNFNSRAISEIVLER